MMRPLSLPPLHAPSAITVGGGSYSASSTSSQELASWRPSLVSADAAILPSRDLGVSRTRDLVRNDPHAQSLVTRRVDLLVGAGLRLVAQIDAESLGITDRAVAREMRRQIEREWRLFANDPLKGVDAQKRLTLNGLLRLQARTWATTGETTAVLKWRTEPVARYRTCLLAIDPDRLRDPPVPPPGAIIKGGVEYDGNGAPVAYHVRNLHPSEFGLEAWERVPRATEWGRPVFVHGFEPDREGQSRAMTPFASLVQRLKMIGRFADTELASATANALFAAFVKSNLPPAEAASVMNVAGTAYADKRLDFWEKNPPTLGGVRIPVLPLGDEIEINAQPRQTTAFPAFQAAFLRSIAAAGSMSYEQLSMDWSQTNYSSARAALNEVWRSVRREFAAYVEQVVMPIYLAFLEEAFDRGYIKVPSGVPCFWDMPAAWAASRWIGAPRGYVDPVKEAQGSALRLDNLTSTLEAECAEQGLDFEDVLEQAEYEAAELARRKLTRTAPGKVAPTQTDEPAPEKEAA